MVYENGLTYTPATEEEFVMFHETALILLMGYVVGTQQEEIERLEASSNPNNDSRIQSLKNGQREIYNKYSELIPLTK